MTVKTYNPKEVPQFNLLQILLMYAWPMAWFMFLIYVVGPFFVTSDGTFPLWSENLIGLLGNGAEITVAILILRREGYRLPSKDLLARINMRFPDKLWEWGACRWRSFFTGWAMHCDRNRFSQIPVTALIMIGKRSRMTG